MPFLDWVNKNQAKETTREVPYHLLKQESVHGDLTGANADNLLIQGDNLLALKALIPFYAGRVKCIYIDPPYNTQSAFEHYDDKLEHSQWLSMMYPRMVLLRELLADDGSIWVSIDDAEVHYLKVLMDEVFGRGRFLTTIAWQQRTTRENRKVFSSNHEYLLVYARKPATFAATRNTLNLTSEVRARYKNPDNDQRGPWQSVSANAQAGHATPTQFYDVTAPSGRVHHLPPGRCWLYTKERMQAAIETNDIWFGLNGNGVPRVKMFLSEVKAGLTPETLWIAADVGTNDFAKKHLVSMLRELEIFDTPKPESLISRVFEIASNPGDLVLDSFLGSGTAATVALKMGRRFIGIEMGDHARTHCIPRLQKVIDGEQGGISGAMEWKGGGGFRFCTLGEPAFDTQGRISAEVKFDTLAAYVWHFETGEPGHQTFDKPLMGIHNGTAYYLLYNGILGDRRPAGGNVLTHAVLQAINEIYPHTGPKVVYGETARLGASRLAVEGITFKQIPYDVKMR